MCLLAALVYPQTAHSLLELTGFTIQNLFLRLVGLGIGEGGGLLPGRLTNVESRATPSGYERQSRGGERRADLLGGISLLTRRDAP